MLIRPTRTAIALALALPALSHSALAQSTATISADPAAPCTVPADGSGTDKACPPMQNGGLGSKIKPLAGSDHESEGDHDGEDDDEEEGED